MLRGVEAHAASGEVRVVHDVVVRERRALRRARRAARELHTAHARTQAVTSQLRRLGH